MKPKSPAPARTIREYRPGVTVRRKMASLRVSLQRRRLRRIAQLSPDSQTIFAELSNESNPTARSYR